MDFDGRELNTPKPNQNLAKKPVISLTLHLSNLNYQVTGKAAAIPGQSVASQLELINELKKAEAQNNIHLVASILETLVTKGLPIDKYLAC